MSEIQINTNNISRFSKRLKKSLEQELGTTVSLSQATLLIAKMLGNSNVFEMQKNLAKVQINPQNAKKVKQQQFFKDNVEYLPNPDNLEIRVIDEYQERYVKYALVPIDFIERNGLPLYLHNSNYSTVVLFGVETSFINSLDEALNILRKTPNKMVLEYAIPAYSHQAHFFGICSEFYWLEDNEIKKNYVNNF